MTTLADCIDESYLFFDYLGNNWAKCCVRYWVDKLAKPIKLQFPVHPEFALNGTDTTFVQTINLASF